MLALYHSPSLSFDVLSLLACQNLNCSKTIASGIFSQDFTIIFNILLGSEIRGQRSEVRGQRSEVRGQRSEVRGQRSEVRGQRSEIFDEKIATVNKN
ncbi:MAG: hypothetical protein ABFQ95_02095 [Pseudomonadota bacterium]